MISFIYYKWNILNNNKIKKQIKKEAENFEI